jgi:hypothetical protein
MDGSLAGLFRLVVALLPAIFSGERRWIGWVKVVRWNLRVVIGVLLHSVHIHLLVMKYSIQI